ncbi:putative E3 ubiquitin-protein ligase HIP1 [Canna indica]|uniref:RING-type E3 ubiquitin transferase n=1 Tax=Canna indica TaxID=4628 RepID=A0AAQ3KYC6_9LILI|nr:putative E3 ubiquitin-protein ligase HIP1 [Canna indica]
MQGQSSTFQTFGKVVEIDRASSSGNSVMDQQVFWNELIAESAENEELPSSGLPSNEPTSCGNVAGQGSGSLNFWDPLGPSSSMPPLSQANRDEIKFESGWTSSVVGNRVGGPRIADGRSEAVNTLSFENENTDLNNHVNNGEQLSQFLDFHGFANNSVYNPEHVGLSSQVFESGVHSGLYNPGIVQQQHVPFTGSSSGGSSSRAIDFFSNNEGDRQEASQCSSHKRKSIERVRGECSASGNSSSLNEGVNLVEEEINARMSTIPRAIASRHHPFGSGAGNSDSFQRNARVRISHADPANTFTPDLWSQDNNITHYNSWPAHQPSATSGPSNQPLDSRFLGSNMGPRRIRHVRTIPVLPPDLYPFPQSGISTTEVGSSSGSSAIAVDGAAVDLNSLGVSGNISEQVFVPPINTRNMVQDQANWGSTGNTVLSGNAVPTSQIGTNIGVYQSPGANWLSHQQRRRISEAVRRSFFSSEAEPRGRSTSLPPRQNNSSTSQEVGRHQSGAASRVQQPYMRLNMLHRQNNGALGIPLNTRTLAAARDGRSRISEIRNVFDLIRRGDNLLLEDVLLLEQSAYIGGANFQDRYRDMRLDVDNMSYEELLALGERIGSVNTGLTEEKILKCLRQCKYVSVASEPSDEVEPCCICREEYIEGEELGRLDCGHDYHSACIKTWLMIKNLCPICKTTALRASEKCE